MLWYALHGLTSKLWGIHREFVEVLELISFSALPANCHLPLQDSLGFLKAKQPCSQGMAGSKQNLPSEGLGFYVSTLCRQRNICQEACHIVTPVMLNSWLCEAVQAAFVLSACWLLPNRCSKLQDLLAVVMYRDICMSQFMCGYTASA